MAGKKILIVDDEPDIVKTTRMLLESEGYRVIAARDAREALDRAQAENPDLIILDVMLPDLNGLELMRILKMREKTRHTPVIIITALTQGCSEELMKKGGAVDFCMKKPFDLEQLSKNVKELLDSG